MRRCSRPSRKPPQVLLDVVLFWLRGRAAALLSPPSQHEAQSCLSSLCDFFSRDVQRLGDLLLPADVQEAILSGKLDEVSERQVRLGSRSSDFA